MGSAINIEDVVLDRVCILGIFCPKQGQGFKPSAAQVYPNIGRVHPPPPKHPNRAMVKNFHQQQDTTGFKPFTFHKIQQVDFKIPT